MAIAPKRAGDKHITSTKLRERYGESHMSHRLAARLLRIWEVTQKDEQGRSSFFPRPSTPASNPWTPWCPWCRAPASSLGEYRGVFEKIYIFCPSVSIDDGWIPVKKYIEREQAYWDERGRGGAAAHHPAAAQDHRDVQEGGDEEAVPGLDYNR